MTEPISICDNSAVPTAGCSEAPSPGLSRDATGSKQLADSSASEQPSRPQTIRELEHLLQANGFSRREARAIAAGGFKAIHNTEEINQQLDALGDALRRYRNIFESES